MRKPLFALAVVLIFGGYAQAQSLSAIQSADRLHMFADTLIQDSQDLIDLAKPRTSDCEVFNLVKDLQTAALESVDSIQAVEFMLRMYSVLSAPTDQVRIQVILEPRIRDYRSDLARTIKSLNLVLAQSQVPSGAAILGTRIRDNVRSASGILQGVVLR